MYLNQSKYTFINITIPASTLLYLNQPQTTLQKHPQERVDRAPLDPPAY